MAGMMLALAHSFTLTHSFPPKIRALKLGPEIGRGTYGIVRVATCCSQSGTVIDAVAKCAVGEVKYADRCLYCPTARC